MAVKLMALRRNDRCSVCGVSTPASTEAWWDSSARHVTCVGCMSASAPAASAPPPATSPWAPPTPIDRGAAGTSAGREARRIEDNIERRRRASDHEADDAPAPNVQAIRRARNFATGAEGERCVGALLDSLTASGVVVLHDRRVPNTRGNIDHLVISPSGIWIVDAKKWQGRIERRRGTRPSQPLLYVNGRNRTKAIENLDWQIQAVRAALTPIGFAEATITGVLCFTGASWGLFARPQRLRGALVTWPDKLVAEIAKDQRADPATVNLVAQQLSSKLPAMTATVSQRPATTGRPIR